jgi:hypothetical protein
VSRRADLIDALSRDLGRPRRLRRPDSLALVWLAGSWVFVIAASHLVQGMRPGFADQLASHPRFAAETLFGLLAVGVASLMAVRLGVPGSGSPRRQVALGLGALGVWASAYVYGLVDPALPPSTLGARPACFLEVIAYGIPVAIAGLVLVRRLASLERVSTGVVLGAAAGAIPALLMEMACMYVPDHILAYHIAPVALVILVGGALGPLLLRRI